MEVQTPPETGALFLFKEADVRYLIEHLPLFAGYTLIILGIIAGLAGNREKLLARVRHQDRDDER